MAEPRLPVLLFDLGGVVIETRTFEALAELLPEPIERGALQDRWLDSEAMRRFELGQIEPDAFAKAFVDEWRLNIGPDAFLQAFARWPERAYPGALERIDSLRRDHTIAFLSNSNCIHWAWLEPVLAHADHAFSSHELGLIKPDAAIFRHVAGALGCAPGDIRFFDDSLKNVRAAEAEGLRAFHTLGFGAVEARLTALGLGQKASGLTAQTAANGNPGG